MQKFSLAIVAILAVVIVATAFHLYSKHPNTPLTPVKTSIPPPPVESLGHGARLPTAEELEQEKNYDAKQVELAIEKLKSSNVHQRIAATETLNAYQIPESERQLSETLLHDENAQVRQAAALSLYLFKELSDRTVDALLKALHDDDKQTRRESFNVLISYALRVNFNDNKFQGVLNKLRKKVRSRHLDQDIRSDLKRFIKDQEPVKNFSFGQPKR
jgi:HEAT repeat protein